jgi:hypothetical protein
VVFIILRFIKLSIKCVKYNTSEYNNQFKGIRTNSTKQTIYLRNSVNYLYDIDFRLLNKNVLNL